VRRLLVLVVAFVGVTLTAFALTYTGTQPQAETPPGPVALGGVIPPDRVDRPGSRPLITDAYRAEGNVVAAAGENAQYNYAPSLMLDGGRVRMWWCSQLVSAAPPGDDVLYAEADSVAGPFDYGRAVFGGTGGGFDGRHTCDPSVVRVGGVYYLYYTGAASDHGMGNAIGLATSPDGVTWTRANGGQPIVTSSFEVSRTNIYGAGQPSAVYLDGWFYLLFTDTNGRGALGNGAGQFVLRSPDPSFASGVESLGPKGFHPGLGRDRLIVDAFSADWMWVDAMNAFAIAHETANGTTITFWDKDFTTNPYQPVLIAGPWQEGPGLLRQPDGHAPITAADPCGRVRIDLVRATRDQAEPTDLKHFGLDLKDVQGCADRTSALTTLTGFAVPSPQRTLDLVLAGKLFRVDRRSVAEALGATIMATRPKGLDAVEPTAQVVAGAQAVRAQGRGVGLLLGNRLYPVPSAAAAEANSSAIADVLPSTWDAYSPGLVLAVSR
jgi:hypothetical protein